jgi:FHA domain
VRFEVRYSNGALHEVELSGTLAVVGRDPSCDLVLNDAKCSRRHAVIEAGPEGLLVRDSGSANGVYVNGKKTERASVKQGDEIRLGEVVLKVLPEEVAGTLVMGPDELPDAVPRAAVSSNADTVPPAFSPIAPPPVPPAVDTPTAARPSLAAAPPTPPPLPVAAAPASAPPRIPKPPAPAPVAPPPALPRNTAPPPRAAPLPARAPRGSGGPVEPLPRPLTGMLLSALWLLGALSYLAAGAILLWLSRSRNLSVAAPLAGCVMLAMLSVTVGVGLWMRAPWARLLQIATAGIGLLTCVYTPLSAAALAYMLRGATRIHFSGRATFGELTAEEDAIVRADSGDGLFMAGVLVGLLVTLVLGGVAFALGVPALPRPLP